jgi:hypothetical protein
MRQGFHDLLIAVHLTTHMEARYKFVLLSLMRDIFFRKSACNEYVIPLLKSLAGKNVFDPDCETRFPHITGDSISIRPIMASDPVRNQITKEMELKLMPPAINFELLKVHVTYALSSATEHAVLNCRDLIGGDNRNHFE